MRIEVVRDKLSLSRLKALAQENFGDMIKGVVDIETKTIALGGELHADAEAVLLEDGSNQEHLWGFNLYPDREQKRLEYTSFINIRPSQGNRSIEIQDTQLRKKISDIINMIVDW